MFCQDAQVFQIKDVVETCAAGRQIGMESRFTDKVATMGASGRHGSNYERDFLRFARKDLGVDFHLYQVKCLCRSVRKTTQEANFGLLLPFEIADLLWEFNPEAFHQLWVPWRVKLFWERTIAANEEWFRAHPLYRDICLAADKTMYLPIHLFGDDATVGKARAMHTMTWMPATHTEHYSMQSRIPLYLFPTYLAIPGVTQSKLQEAIVWSFFVWLKGTYPHLDHEQRPFPKGSLRDVLSQKSRVIAGGRTGVFVGNNADALWISQHFRYGQSWSSQDICGRCTAQNIPGALDFCRFTACPVRSHRAYMSSQGARQSPLSQMPGYHLHGSTRGELMHSGALGALPDAIGSAIIECCDEGRFGGLGLSPWEFRIQVQLNAGFSEFASWAKAAGESHTLKRFSRTRFDMHTLSKSFPCFKGNAHNGLVVGRWLEQVCADCIGGSAHNKLRWQVLWSWVEVFRICLTSDPDFLSSAQLKQLDDAVAILLHGSKALASQSAAALEPRWKLRPKLHTIMHINQDSQASGRNPRAWWTFKDEESMGKLSKIARATHPVTMKERSLERWCLQFFSFFDKSD